MRRTATELLELWVLERIIELGACWLQYRIVTVVLALATAFGFTRELFFPARHSPG